MYLYIIFYIYNQWRIFAHWENKYSTGVRATHVCFLPAVQPDLCYIQLRTARRARFSPQLLLFRCRRSIRHVRDMAYPHRCVANIYSWDRFRTTYACFIPAV